MESDGVVFLGFEKFRYTPRTEGQHPPWQRAKDYGNETAASTDRAERKRERHDPNPISIPVRSSDWGDGFYHRAEGSDNLQWIMGKNYEDVIRYISGVIWIHTIYSVINLKQGKGHLGAFNSPCLFTDVIKCRLFITSNKSKILADDEVNAQTLLPVLKQ